MFVPIKAERIQHPEQYDYFLAAGKWPKGHNIILLGWQGSANDYIFQLSRDWYIGRSPASCPAFDIASKDEFGLCRRIGLTHSSHRWFRAQLNWINLVGILQQHDWSCVVI